MLLSLTGRRHIEGNAPRALAALLATLLRGRLRCLFGIRKILVHDMHMSRRSQVFSAALLVVLVLDQVLRVVALRRVVGWRVGLIEFGYYPNSGAIFSWPVPVAVMTVITGAILVGLAILLVRMQWRRGEWFALGLLSMLAAGAASQRGDSRTERHDRASR